MKRKLLLLAAATVLSGCGERPGVQMQPGLELLFSGDLELPSEGCDTSFAFRLVNPVSDGNLQAGSSETWLGGFTPASDSTVTFTAAPNESETQRSAVVSLVYTYGGDTEIRREFTAVQKARDAGTPDEPWTGVTPDIILNDIQAVPAEGGTVSVFYYLVDPVDGGKLSMTWTDAWWVSDMACDTVEAKITFNVAANDGEKRSFFITLAYLYGASEKLEKTIEIVQTAAESEGPTYERRMTDMMGIYYGNEDTYTDVHEYHTFLSNLPFDTPGDYTTGSSSYNVEIYGAAPADAAVFRPLAGTYGYGITFMMNTFSIVHVDAFGDVYGFYDGTMTVDYDEAGNMVLDILATDENGDVHHVTYTGAPDYTDGRD